MASCSDDVGSSSDCGLRKLEFSSTIQWQESIFYIPATSEDVATFALYLQVLVYGHRR